MNVPKHNADLDHSLAILATTVEAVRLERPHAVGALMTRGVKSCRSDDKLARCAQIMWEQPCGAVPIIDDAGRAIAMVTDRDIAMAAYLQGKPIAEIVVSSAMSRSIFSVHVSQSIWSAEGIMRRHGVRRLPVVDDRGLLVGVVSIDDIALHISRHASTDDPLSPQAFAATVAALSHSVAPGR